MCIIEAITDNLLLIMSIFVCGIAFLLMARGQSEEFQETAGTPDSSNAKRYIDLHLHLDGAITVEIAKELARLQDITLPADNDKMMRNWRNY